MVGSTPDQLGLECQPVDARLSVSSIFTDHNLCRAMPTNLHQISSSGISPEETKLANLKHGVVTLILPQEGTSQFSNPSPHPKGLLLRHFVEQGCPRTKSYHQGVEVQVHQKAAHQEREADSPKPIELERKPATFVVLLS